MEELYLEHITTRGCLEVICGSMFSGKTEELIRRIKRARFANLRIKTFKPAIDVRYSNSDVVSHDAHAINSLPVKEAKEILDLVGDAQVIGIDEVQFFDESIVDVCKQLADAGVRVICAGLDMDYLGKPFGPMPRLMAMAEYVTKVHAICVMCGDLAQHSYRTIKNDNLVVLGETNAYKPLCRACYNKAMARIADTNKNDNK